MHAEQDAGRRAHYAGFYDSGPPAGPFGLVVGNCQAESVRLVIEQDDLPMLRVPPVHELTAADAGRLRELVPHADALVMQPVKDDYHGFAVGTAQLRALLRDGARSVTFPVTRHSALYPAHAAFHVEGFGDPPIVAYHDVRALAAAAGIGLPSRLSAASVRLIGAESLAELQRRERGLDVAVSDLLAQPSFAHMRTINHPGNPVILALGSRILEVLGRDGRAVRDPGRPLLNAVHAPREPGVIDAWGLTDDEQADWIVDGVRIETARVLDAHREWYAQRPGFVAAGVERLGRLLGIWA